MNKDIQKFEKLSFWELLETRSIEIPIIQRDYAQGRARKEKVRNDFLNALKQALAGNPVELDFIYGSEKNNILQPLDGQQRLTTLFLLHWFIANKEGKLEEAKSRLSKFTYETRTSSREFCKELSNSNIEINNVKVSEAIKDQSWFVDFWQKDPTISAMLIMLDAIQDKFKDTAELWDKLTSKTKLPIAFLYIKLENFGLSDDLYIKMNSRGKPLTEFENFKANFSVLFEDVQKSKLDNEWLDIFWKSERDNTSINIEKVDEKYFNFIKNMSFCFYVEKNDIDKEEKDNFNIFDRYKEIFNSDYLYKISRILDALTTFNDIEKYFADFLKENPDYAEYLRFYASAQFFIHVENFNIENYNKWIRVCRNLINNTPIPSPDVFGRIIRSINQLAAHISNIYEYLSTSENKISGFLQAQYEEERAKAKQIINDKTATWESKIIKAENTAFFKGAIRFLFTNESGKYDWSLFDERLKKSKQYFDVEGVKDKYKDDALLLRVLITKFNQKDNFEQLSFNSKANNWKKILTNSNLTNAVCALFNETIIDTDYDFESFSPDWTDDDSLKMCHTDLLVSKFLAKYKDEDRKLTFDYWGKHVLHCGQDVIIIGDKRNAILSKLFDDQIIKSNQKISDIPYFRLWQILFKYQGYKYQWTYDDHIYLLKEDGSREKDADGKEIGIPCADINAENITEKLDSLIPN
jgi:hypothetical protein